MTIVICDRLQAFKALNSILHFTFFVVEVNDQMKLNLKFEN